MHRSFTSRSDNRAGCDSHELHSLSPCPTGRVSPVRCFVGWKEFGAILLHGACFCVDTSPGLFNPMASPSPTPAIAKGHWQDPGPGSVFVVDDCPDRWSRRCPTAWSTFPTNPIHNESRTQRTPYTTNPVHDGSCIWTVLVGGFASPHARSDYVANGMVGGIVPTSVGLSPLQTTCAWSALFPEFVGVPFLLQSKLRLMPSLVFNPPCH